MMASKVKSEDVYDISLDDEIIKEESKVQRVRRSVSAAQKAAEITIDQIEQCVKSIVSDQVVLSENGEFLCPTCPRSFKSLPGRKRHMNKCSAVVESNLKNCPCCSEPIESAHKNGTHACEECDGMFTSADNLERHVITVHREIETFGCIECPARFLDKTTLTAHLEKHNEAKQNKMKPWSCKECNTLFTRKYHLHRHYLQTGCGGKKTSAHECQVCGRVFTRKDNLREHLRVHAGINKRLTWYKCDFCNKDVAGLTNFNLHRREHVGDRPYKCRFCDKHFPTSGAQKKHIRTHTGEKPYQCSECRRKFAAKETLNRHLKTHTKERPFKCEICGKGFIQGSQLRHHMFHHTGENGFKCDNCGASFARKAKLEIHVKYAHEGADPLICDMCSKSFLRKEDMIKHFLTHSQEKAFECEVCLKRFSQKAYLKVHRLTHTKEPPRACNYCNRAFIRQDCLLRHMRHRHRDKLHEILIEAERKKLKLQLLAMTENAPSNQPLKQKKKNTVTSLTRSKTYDAKDKNSHKLREKGQGKDREEEEYHELDQEDTIDDSNRMTKLSEQISSLLEILVDEDTLKGLGAPDTPTVDVLKRVIERCGHTPVDDPENLAPIDCLRENAKLLFTVVIDDAAVKSLLNNQSVDDVIHHVLNLVQS